MLLIIPFAHERSEVRRLPHVSMAILAVNLFAFVSTYVAEGDREARAASAFRDALERQVETPHATISDELLKVVLDEQERAQFADRRELARNATRKPLPEVLRRQQEELDELGRKAMARFRELYYVRLGFTPARPNASGFLTSLFVHGDWFHLVGNMLYFYLSGPFLEDVFGRPLFLALYLAGGFAATAAQWASDPGSSAPMLGASGAIAALMGAFLVRFATTRIRFAYLFVFLWPLRLLFVGWRGSHRMWRGTFWAPAWIMLPLWLLWQFWAAAKFGNQAGVAFWAHIGGFGFGLAVALAVRLTRIEERFIHPAIEAEISYARHPGLTRGIEAASAGRHRQARWHLREALAATPNDPDVHLELYRAALALGDEREARAHAVQHAVLEARNGRWGPAWLTYLEAASRWTDLVWPASFLLALGRSREREHDAVAALDTYRRVPFWHPDDPAAARALLQIANLLAGQGDAAGAVAALEQALAVKGIEPALRVEIEARLEDLRAIEPAPGPAPAVRLPPVQPLPRRRLATSPPPAEPAADLPFPDIPVEQPSRRPPGES